MPCVQDVAITCRGHGPNIKPKIQFSTGVYMHISSSAANTGQALLAVHEFCRRSRAVILRRWIYGDDESAMRCRPFELSI